MTQTVEQGIWERPQDTSAEASVLGAMLLSGPAVGDVAAVLEVADFYIPAHQTVFAAVVDLFERGLPVDPVTVIGELGRRGEALGVGGAPFLHHLITTCPSVGSVLFYARIVREKAIARRLVQAGTRIVQIGSGPGDVDDMLAQAEQALSGAATSTTADDASVLGELLDPVIDDLDKATVSAGIPTGFIDLDLLLNPLEPGQLVIIAARPSIGKSTVLLDLCRNTSVRLGFPSLLISMEMQKVEMVRRTISAESKTTLERLQRHTLDDADWARITEARERILGAPLWFDRPPTLTLGSLRASIRRHKPKLVGVDYLQLMTMPGGSGSDSKRREGIEEATRGLKLMAQTENVPIVMLSQLNRNAETRHDKRPAMSDLRESGSIEQDADVVILLHRPDFYDFEDRPGEMDVIVAKQRNGPTGQVTLSAQLHYSRLQNMANGGWQQ